MDKELESVLESAIPLLEKYGLEIVSVKEEYVKPTIWERILKRFDKIKGD